MESEAAILSDTVDDLTKTDAATIERVTVSEPTGAEVIVEIAAASLCYTDVSAALGEKPEPLPVVMGHEGAGVVHSVGEDVDGLRAGDHVVLGRIACGRCNSCRAGHSNQCQTRRTRQSEGTLRTGERRFHRNGSTLNHFHGVSSFTEYSSVTEDVAIKITEEVPLEEATLLGCGVFTGIGAVMNTADIESGASVAIFGAGGVGLSALQGAVMRSASKTVVVDPVAKKRSIASDLGATETIDPTDRDPVKQIRDLTDGGVNYAIEAVGRPSVMEQTVNALGQRGTAVLVGTSPKGNHNVELDLRSITTGERNIAGSFNGSYNLPLAIPQLAEFVADGRLSLTEMISDTKPLKEVNEAMAELQQGTAMRQVLVP